MKYIKRYLGKFASSARSPLKQNFVHALWAFLGGSITAFVLASFSSPTGLPLLMAPFGASCVLAFGIPDAPLSQPRNIIGGHFLTTLCGLMVLHLAGSGVWALSLGVGLGIAAMLLTKTTHPPAGANPIIVITSASTWSFLVTPVLTGSIMIVCVALLYNNLFKNRKYPTFWI
ncbi:HPP family protein [Paenibacillus sp. JX-17]|uniref:HPP family protein n=1 Tax=Paenibacillus lacisoli TaxID=3064525 RepID=A0ABT9CK29_9BACL|nr:HPP family protein [Paenibacillus sp. JX-17]